MPKIHARMSVEIEVTEEEFNEIVKDATNEYGNIEDLEIPFDLSDLESRAKPCDWDDGGYIPGSWLEEDIDDSGDD